jgi:hypothetical protein
MSIAVQPRPSGPPPILAEALENGLTSRTWPVILYGAFILMPANIYLMLVAGQSLLGPISFIALILWVEAARLSRKPLSTAEAFIVYSVSAVAAGQMLFYMYALHPAYFRISEISNSTLFSFTDPETGLLKTFGEAAPSWWAPPRDIVLQRSFLHKEWIVPLAVGAASWLCHMLADLSMGVLGRELFIKVEKLPFPYAHPPAEACKALTRNQPEAKKVFTICGLFGAVWGLIIYFPVALGKKIVDFPIPWADFNHSLHSVRLRHPVLRQRLGDRRPGGIPGQVGLRRHRRLADLARHRQPRDGPALLRPLHRGHGHQPGPAQPAVHLDAGLHRRHGRRRRAAHLLQPARTRADLPRPAADRAHHCGQPRRADPLAAAAGHHLRFQRGRGGADLPAPDPRLPVVHHRAVRALLVPAVQPDRHSRRRHDRLPR